MITIEDKHNYGSLNVSILADHIPELSESFKINLAKIDLITSRITKFGYVNGLQVDIPPQIGPRSSVVFTILKNDDANGVVEFQYSRLVVHEHDGIANASLRRSGKSCCVFCTQLSVVNTLRINVYLVYSYTQKTSADQN